MAQRSPILDIGNPLQIVEFRQKCLTFFGSCPIQIDQSYMVTVFPRRCNRRPAHRIRKKDIIRVYCVGSLDDVDDLLDHNPHQRKQLHLWDLL
jgi:hypothetical protein